MIIHVHCFFNEIQKTWLGLQYISDGTLKNKLNKLKNITFQQWRIQDFPLGGPDPSGSTNLQCGDVCENKRIGSHWGGARRRPLEPPMLKHVKPNVFGPQSENNKISVVIIPRINLDQPAWSRKQHIIVLFALICDE